MNHNFLPSGVEKGNVINRLIPVVRFLVKFFSPPAL